MEITHRRSRIRHPKAWAQNSGRPSWLWLIRFLNRQTQQVSRTAWLRAKKTCWTRTLCN